MAKTNITIDIELKNRDEYLKKLDRLEQLIKEMREIVSWDFRAPVLIIKELPGESDSSSEITSFHSQK